jgi:copper(I)-binding protein
MPALGQEPSQANAQGIEVHDAYARALGGAGSAGAVFFALHNHGPEDAVLIGAATPAAAMAEFHTHKESADGLMQMLPIEGGIAMPSGAKHSFGRGEDHLMLMGLTTDLSEGDIITITLTFDGADPLTFEAVVDNARTEPSKHEHGG